MVAHGQERERGKLKEMMNTFWIAANIIFDLSTGTTKQVLMLVNRADDATVFSSEKEAETYLNFVQVRAPNIRWVIEIPTPLIATPMPQKPQGYLIRGVQTTAGG